MQRLLERAPPARRIASCARSYVCFGPIIPVGFARERLGACLKIASCEQGGRAHLAQGLLARNKRRSERSSRCAARAALDLTGTEDAAATLARNHRISHRYSATLRPCEILVGSGLPAMKPTPVSDERRAPLPPVPSTGSTHRSPPVRPCWPGQSCRPAPSPLPRHRPAGRCSPPALGCECRSQR